MTLNRIADTDVDTELKAKYSKATKPFHSTLDSGTIMPPNRARLQSSTGVIGQNERERWQLQGNTVKWYMGTIDGTTTRSRYLHAIQRVGCFGI